MTIMREWRPKLSPEFTGAARRHMVDLALMLTLFFSASVLAGRVWRFPFDDEISTLSVIERMTARKLLTFFPGQVDVHPPLSYLLFAGLQAAGFSLPAMRLVSLTVTAGALALFQMLALSTIERRADDGGFAVRLITILLFGLCPLAVSQGDALRWYPLFALLIALFVTLNVAAGNAAAWLASGAALGLAGSTDLLAGTVALAFAIHRYALQRRFRPDCDIGFWLVALAFGALGAYTAGSLLFVRPAIVGTQLGSGIVRAALTDLLGFFGGDALGVSQAWIVIPAIAIAGLAVLSAIDRKQPGKPEHLLLLMLATAALSALAGLAKPRSFLYLAPVVLLLMTLYLHRMLREGQAARALVLAVLPLTVAVAAVANINATTHPFKRNAAIPYRSVLDFIDANKKGRLLVVSTDPVVPWELQHTAGREAVCASYFFGARQCFAPGQAYDSIVLIHGHSNQSGHPALIRRFDDKAKKLIAGRRKIVTLYAGYDADAALKTRLTGVPLGEHILTVELYR